jgi:hypothetical protein
MSRISLGRHDIDRDATREAAAYPLPSAARRIKAFDKRDLKRRRALRGLVILGLAICFWSCAGCSDETALRTRSGDV